MPHIYKEKQLAVTSKIWAKILIGVAIFCVSLGVGYWIGRWRTLKVTQKIIQQIIPVRENNFNYQFIYPLLRYNFGTAASFLEDHTLEQKINEYIQTQYADNNAESISVYVRDMRNGQWAGVNADTKYHPGSIMKVLILMGYFREQQLDPSVLSKPLLYSEAVSDAVGNIPDTTVSNLVVGESYSTNYLLQDMIENSDNGAETLLAINSNEKILDAVYQDLNIPIPETVPDYTISPKEYAAFLAILYNSTYLTEANSEAALAMMSQSTFKDGISAGVPSGVVVAQKYGEHVDTDSSGNTITDLEFHNCGIVYTKTDPYEICIMTKSAYHNQGHAAEEASAAMIKDISAIVYNYMSTGNSQ